MSSVLTKEKKEKKSAVKLIRMRAKKHLTERGVKIAKNGGKLGGCSKPGGLKKNKNIKNLPLQVPPANALYSYGCIKIFYIL